MNSTVVIACLFLPKMYIIIFHPDKNVRKVIIKQANCSTSGRFNEPTSSTSQCGNGASYEPVKSLALPSTPAIRERKEHKEKEVKELERREKQIKEEKTNIQTNGAYDDQYDTSYPVATEINRVELTKDGKIIVRVINGDREEVVENEFISRRKQFESL